MPTHEFIQPNLHIILIHYPLGLLVMGVLIELFSFLWRESSVRVAGRWMILLGALSALPAATSGIYAFRDVVSKVHDVPWEQVKASSTFSDGQWEAMRSHIIFNAAGVGVFALIVVSWLGASDQGRERLRFPLLLLAIVGLGCLMVAAWHGGEMVYTYGTGVGREPAIMEEHISPGQAESMEDRIDRFVPRLQMHVIGAGLVGALALAALGMSLRSLTIHRSGGEGWRGDFPADRDATIADVHAALSDDHWNDPIIRRVPSSRFWLLAALLALITAVGGLWVINTWRWDDLKADLLPHGADWRQSRSLVHVVLGLTIIASSLILAAVTRWAPRSRVLLGIFSLLVLGALAAQIWIGTAMMYDTPSGPLLGWNHEMPATQPTTNPEAVR